MASTKDLAHISDAIYDGSNSNGWYITDMTSDSYGFGFKAGVYKNWQGELVIAYCGSDDIVDWVDNARFLFNRAPSQATEAVKYYLSVDKSDYNITITGHSLGGALAEIVGNMFEVKTATFNSPGTKGIVFGYLHSNYQVTKTVEKNPNAEGMIDHFLTSGDIVSLVNDHIGKVHWEAPKEVDGLKDLDLLRKLHSMDQWKFSDKYDGNGNYKETEIYDYGYPFRYA